MEREDHRIPREVSRIVDSCAVQQNITGDPHLYRTPYDIN